MDNVILQSALAYARAGIPVFPCKPDKKPYTTHGFKDATTDEAQIIAWWTAWPDAMIGVPMGTASGLWALDIDAPKTGNDADGHASLHKLVATYGPLPLTWTQKTSGGGIHYIFSYPPDGERVPNRTGIVPKIDVRGDGGYIIIAPSINGEGKAYSFLNNAPPVSAPEWLLALVRQSTKTTPQDINPPPASGIPPEVQAMLNIVHPYAQKALDDECAKVAAAQEGTRNTILNKAAFSLGTLVGGGTLDEKLVSDTLMSAALQCGLPTDEAGRTIVSGITNGKQNPRGIPELCFTPAQTANGIPMAAGVTPTPLQVSEESIASAFTARYAETLRFCTDWACWLEWNPQKHIWEQDKTHRAFDYARRECKALNPGNKPSLGKSATAAGVERFARADPRHATTNDLWDSDPLILGTPNGVINLKQ